MAKNVVLETQYEKFLRTRAEEICQSYIGWAHEITCGEVKPNRIIQRLAQEKGMTGEGVKSILKRFGVYKSAKQPIILQKSEPVQLSMFRGDKAPVARV